MKVFNEKGEKLTSNASTIPGSWTKIANGSTSVAFDTEVVLTTFVPDNNEIYMPIMTLREPGNTNGDVYLNEARTTSVPIDNDIVYSIARPQSSTTYEFRIRHKLKNSGGSLISGTFDWVLYKVII